MKKEFFFVILAARVGEGESFAAGNTAPDLHCLSSLHHCLAFVKTKMRHREQGSDPSETTPRTLPRGPAANDDVLAAISKPCTTG